MDFLELKHKASRLKDSARKASQLAVEFGTSKLADSKMTLNTIAELDKFLEKSKTTVGKDSQTGKEKKFKHRIIVIFADTKSDFFTQMLYIFPILSAKVFSQNMHIRLANISMKKLDKDMYHINATEVLVVIENMKVIKTINGAENIQKIVKSLSLDINKSVDEL